MRLRRMALRKAPPSHLGGHGCKAPSLRSNPCRIYRNSIDFHRKSMEGRVMGKLAVRALRAVLAVVLAGTVFVQAGMVWALVGGSDPEDGSLPLTALRVITILGMMSAQ